MHRFASILLVDPQGRVLLQERDEHPVIDPERWGLVGGHVEDGESFEVAAYRELAEETGLRLDSGRLHLWGEVEVFHEGYGTRDTVQVWYAGVSLTDRDITVGEGRQIVFVAPAAALALDLGAGAARILPDFLTSPAYRSLRKG